MHCPILHLWVSGSSFLICLLFKLSKVLNVLFFLRHLGRISLQMRSTKAGPVLQELPHLVASSRHREGSRDFPTSSRRMKDSRQSQSAAWCSFWKTCGWSSSRIPRTWMKKVKWFCCLNSWKLRWTRPCSSAAIIGKCLKHQTRKSRPRSFKKVICYLSSWKVKSLILSQSSGLDPYVDKTQQAPLPTHILFLSLQFQDYFLTDTRCCLIIKDVTSLPFLLTSVHEGEFSHSCCDCCKFFPFLGQGWVLFNKPQPHTGRERYLRRRMGWATANFLQAILASHTRLSDDLESLVSARRLMNLWTRASSCKENNEQTVKKFNVQTSPWLSSSVSQFLSSYTGGLTEIIFR